MRIVLLSAAAVALSGCSWLGLGGSGGSYGHDIGTYKASHAGQQGSDCCPLSRWNVEGGIGKEIIRGPSFVNLSDADAVPGVLPNTVSASRAFDDATRYEWGGSYALNPNRKISLIGHRVKADGNNIALGREASGDLVRGDVSDYDAWGLEAGLRQYALPIKAPLIRSFRPYVEGRVGASKVDDISISGVNGTSFTQAGLYEGGWVPTGAGLLGVETPVFNRFTMGVETGLRYEGKLKSDTSTLATGTSFSGVNSGGDRWSIPVTLRGRYRF